MKNSESNIFLIYNSCAEPESTNKLPKNPNPDTRPGQDDASRSRTGEKLKEIELEPPGRNPAGRRCEALS